MFSHFQLPYLFFINRKLHGHIPFARFAEPGLFCLPMVYFAISVAFKKSQATGDFWYNNLCKVKVPKCPSITYDQNPYPGDRPHDQIPVGSFASTLAWWNGSETHRQPSIKQLIVNRSNSSMQVISRDYFSCSSYETRAVKNLKFY